METEKIIERKKARDRKMWRKIFIASLVPVVVSLIFFGCIPFAISVFFALFSYGEYYSLEPAKDYGPAPWWYYGL